MNQAIEKEIEKDLRESGLGNPAPTIKALRRSLMDGNLPAKDLAAMCLDDFRVYLREMHAAGIISADWRESMMIDIISLEKKLTYVLQAVQVRVMNAVRDGKIAQVRDKMDAEENDKFQVLETL